MSRTGDRGPGTVNRDDKSLLRIRCHLFPVVCCRFSVSFLLILWLSPCLCSQSSEPKSSTEVEQFFIISSVDSNKEQLVLKRPTEVTLLVRVNGRTAYSDEKGKPLQLNDFRAGDTVYVALRSGTQGPPVVTRIRKGLMTLDELRRRYLKVQSGKG